MSRAVQAKAYGVACVEVGNALQRVEAGSACPEVVLDAALAVVVAASVEAGIELSAMKRRLVELYSITERHLAERPLFTEAPNE